MLHLGGILSFSFRKSTCCLWRIFICRDIISAKKRFVKPFFAEIAIYFERRSTARTQKGGRSRPEMEESEQIAGDARVLRFDDIVPL